MPGARGRVDRTFNPSRPEALAELDDAALEYDQLEPYSNLDAQTDADLADAPLTYEGEGYTPDTATPRLRRMTKGKVEADPFAVGEQQSALRDMLGIAEGGGLTDIDRERIAQRRALEGMAVRGSEGAYAQDLSERGIGGGTNDILRAQVGAQGGVQADAAHGRELDAMAQRRALEAMARAGSMGSTLRGQSYGEASRRAEAQDLNDKFRADASTRARAWSANERNRASLQNASAPLTRYDMTARTAQGKLAGIAGVRAEEERRHDEQTSTMGDIGGAGLGVIGGVVGGVVGGPAGASAGFAAGNAAGHGLNSIGRKDDLYDNEDDE
jgi:hypothetical protein